MPPICAGEHAAGKRREAFLTTISATVWHGARGNSTFKERLKTDGTEQKRNKTSRNCANIIETCYTFTRFQVHLTAVISMVLWTVKGG